MPKESKQANAHKGKVITGDESPFFHFEKDGDFLTGVFRGLKDGVYGQIVMLEAGGKIVNLPGCKVIADAIPLMAIGKTYTFEFLGLGKSKTGTEYKKFKIYEE